MVGFKHNKLKNKSFDDIQKLFQKAMKRVNTFVDMDTKLVEGSEVREEGSEVRAKGSEVRAKAEIAQESSSKRAGTELEQEKILVVKVVESSVNILNCFDREDLETLWKLVKAKHESTRPEVGYERMLWGDLKTMFDPHVEDQGRIVGIKRLHDDLGVTTAKPPSVVSRAPSAAAVAPVPVDTTCIPSSTLVDQDAPSVSTSQALEDSQEPVLHQDVEVQVPLNAQFTDPFANIFNQEPSSKKSTSRVVIELDVHINHQPFKHLRKRKKIYLLDNVIGNPSRIVSTRKQLQTDAMWCYFDAFLTSIVPKNYKKSLLESS
ncbi:hypothetical protein Tco_0992092 [Tanacetum coccineum]|uniref:Uncharacterized protein n=1 Tax=Tanacetum coccineum TaxID=301880 RepID=A0ABQ5F1U2_9ASTR